MRQIPKVVEISQNATKVQMENALKNLLNEGWDLVSVFNHNNKTYAILTKVVVR